MCFSFCFLAQGRNWNLLQVFFCCCCWLVNVNKNMNGNVAMYVCVYMPIICDNTKVFLTNFFSSTILSYCWKVVRHSHGTKKPSFSIKHSHSSGSHICILMMNVTTPSLFRRERAREGKRYRFRIHNKRTMQKILNKNYNSRYIWQTVCKLLWREENMVTEMCEMWALLLCLNL